MTDFSDGHPCSRGPSKGDGWVRTYTRTVSESRGPRTSPTEDRCDRRADGWGRQSRRWGNGVQSEPTLETPGTSYPGPLERVLYDGPVCLSTCLSSSVSLPGRPSPRPMPVVGTPIPSSRFRRSLPAGPSSHGDRGEIDRNGHRTPNKRLVVGVVREVPRPEARRDKDGSRVTSHPGCNPRAARRQPPTSVLVEERYGGGHSPHRSHPSLAGDRELSLSTTETRPGPWNRTTLPATEGHFTPPRLRFDLP